MSAIHSSQASGGLDLAQLQAALAGVGAVKGELRTFIGTTAPASWTERTASFPPVSTFTPGQTVVVGRRANTTYDSQAANASCVAQGLDGKTYTIQNYVNQAGSLFECYDPLTNTTTSLAQYPLSLAAGDNSVPALVAIPGYILAFGGRVGQASTAECYRFNLATKAWEAIASMPGVRQAIGAVKVGGYVYLYGGAVVQYSSVVSRYNSVLRYNIATNAHTTLAATLPQGTVEGVTAAILPSGKVLVAGGWLGAQVLKYVLFNPATETFEALQNYPAGLTPLGAVSPTATGAFSYAAIGSNNFHNFVSYTEAANSWSISAARLPGLNAWAYGNTLLADGSHFSPSTLSGQNYWATRTYLTQPVSGVLTASKD